MIAMSSLDLGSPPRVDGRHQPGEIVLNGTLMSLHSYWCAKKGSRRMPSRKDIDPIEIPTLLPHLLLFELHEGRLRYRLTGSVTVDLFGRDPTGKYLDETLSERRYKVAIATYELACANLEPFFRAANSSLSKALRS